MTTFHSFPFSPSMVVMDSVVVYVDGFCDANTDAAAALGAIRFLDQLTSDAQNK